MIVPYIKKSDREKLAVHRTPKTAGELNYLLTLMCHRYIKFNKESYQSYNDVIGALEGCKLELYRRKVAPYEEIKISENGDV